MRAATLAQVSCFMQTDGRQFVVAKCIGGSIAVALENKELWQTFSVVGTEMILTKTGRYDKDTHGKVQRCPIAHTRFRTGECFRRSPCE